MRRWISIFLLVAVAHAQFTVPTYNAGHVGAPPTPPPAPFVWLKLCGDTASSSACSPSSSTSIRDSSGNGINATIQGSNGGGPNYYYTAATGRTSVPYAASFNGTDDFAIIGGGIGSPNYFNLAFPLTMCFWEYPDVTPVGWPVVFANSANNLGVLVAVLFTQGGGNVGFYQTYVGNYTTGSTLPLPASQWNFICGVAASTTSRTIYVNGTAGTTDTSSVGVYTPNYSLMVGGWTQSTSGPVFNFANGTIGDVTFFPWALSPTEMGLLQSSQAMNHAPNLFDSEDPVLASLHLDNPLLYLRSGK